MIRCSGVSPAEWGQPSISRCQTAPQIWLGGNSAVLTRREIGSHWRVVAPLRRSGHQKSRSERSPGKIAREIVHPCPAIDPTTRSIFGTVDFERINGAARVAERHHEFRKSGGGLTDALYRSLRNKLIDLRTGIGLTGLITGLRRATTSRKLNVGQRARGSQLPTA
jgi:hypothetical protein